MSLEIDYLVPRKEDIINSNDASLWNSGELSSFQSISSHSNSFESSQNTLQQKLLYPFCRWGMRPREHQRFAQDHVASKEIIMLNIWFPDIYFITLFCVPDCPLCTGGITFLYLMEADIMVRLSGRLGISVACREADTQVKDMVQGSLPPTGWHPLDLNLCIS